MDFKNYLFLSLAGIFTTGFKLLKGNDHSARNIALKVMIALIIALFFIPAIMEWFDLSIKIGLGLTALFTMISEQVVDIIEKKVPQKLNDKINRL